MFNNKVLEMALCPFYTHENGSSDNGMSSLVISGKELSFKYKTD